MLDSTFHGKTEWISLKTRNKAVAKIELAKRLQSHYAEAASCNGNATVAGQRGYREGI